MARTIIISHRRSGGTSNDVPTASFTAVVASVLGAKPDLTVTFVQGRAQTVVPQLNRDWDFFDYALGAFGAITGGFGWNGPALLATPFIGQAGLETSASYTVGAVTGADLNAGSGWADAPLIAAY